MVAIAGPFVVLRLPWSECVEGRPQRRESHKLAAAARGSEGRLGIRADSESCAYIRLYWALRDTGSKLSGPSKHREPRNRSEPEFAIATVARRVTQRWSQVSQVTLTLPCSTGSQIYSLTG